MHFRKKKITNSSSTTTNTNYWVGNKQRHTYMLL